jgi:hypothetical protein
MDDLLIHFIDAPVANILIVGGLAFLAIAVLGKISGKIEPDPASRIMAGILGTVLFVFGIYLHTASDRERSPQNQASTTTSSSDSKPSNEPSPHQEPDEQKKRIHPAIPTEEPKVPAKTEQQSLGSRLVGRWSNENPQTNGIKELQIWQDGNVVLIRVWAKQDSGELIGRLYGGGKGAAIGAYVGTGTEAPIDWGTKKATLSENSASVVWDQASVVRYMTITPDAGRLQVVVDNTYKDNRPVRRLQEYFVQNE